MSRATRKSQAAQPEEFDDPQSTLDSDSQTDTAVINSAAIDDDFLAIADDELAIADDDQQPGGLLHDLDRRQNDVLEQLDDLQAKIDSVLAEMGITSLDDIELGDEFDE